MKKRKTPGSACPAYRGEGRESRTSLRGETRIFNVQHSILNTQVEKIDSPRQD
jgi:hypothetical protein